MHTMHFPRNCGEQKIRTTFQQPYQSLSRNFEKSSSISENKLFKSPAALPARWKRVID
nr:MAG TPA: hypothetical protein [Caudoviricetes sp.]